MNRQKMVLAVLLVLFAISLVYSFTHQPRQKSVDKLKYTSGMTASSPRTASKVLDEKKLHLELLDRGVPGFSGFRRNIFRPIFSDETKMPPLSSPVGKVTLPIPPPVQVPAPAPPPAPEPPPAPKEIAKFTFLGFLQKDNRKTIFLSKDNEIILVKQGDKIAGKYEAANISDEALTINVLADGEQIIIPLVENRPLVGDIQRKRQR